MRVKSIISKDPGGNDIINYQYNYDRMDNILTKDTEHGEYIYDYDDLYRLTSSSRDLITGTSLDEGFTYDKVGNRLTSADTTGNWTYNQNNELGAYDNTSFVYDDNGNMISKTDQTGTTTYIYDIENRLVQVSIYNLPSPISYYYDPFGRRLWKEVGGVRTYFIYADEGLVAELDEAGSETKTYGYVPDSTWTTDPLFMEEDGNYYFYHNDHLGTPQKMTSVNGAIVWSANYEAFGKTNVEVAIIKNNIRFSGQYYDSETRLHYNYMRYYDTELGRYLSIDPISFFGGDINLYNYVWSDPWNNIDPTGEFGIIGVLFGVASDLAIQLALNGGRIECIDWFQVGISGALGAVGGGFITGAFKHSKKGLSWFKASKEWGAVSHRYRRMHKVADTKEVHHFFFSRNGKVGKLIPDAIKNHPANLNPIDKSIHQRITGNHPTLSKFGPFRRWYYGTPRWAKTAEISAGSGAADELFVKECEPGCN